MQLGIVLAVVVICSGWAAQRGLRWKRQRDAFERHLEEKDLASRRHHFRGALDVELEQGPTEAQGPIPGPDPGRSSRPGPRGTG